MNPIKAIYCRAVQAVFRAALPVLESYGPCIHKKLHQLGIAAGVCAPEESDADAAAKFIQAIRNLNARMNIPAHLEGIRESDIPVMAAHAEKEANPLYPVPRAPSDDAGGTGGFLPSGCGSSGSAPRGAGRLRPRRTCMIIQF